MMEQRRHEAGRQDSEKELAPPREPSDAADTGTQSPSASSSDFHHPPATQFATPSRASGGATAGADGGGGGGWGSRFKRFEGHLRQGLEVIGANTIRHAGCAVTEPVRATLGDGTAGAVVAEAAVIQGQEDAPNKDVAPAGSRGAGGDQGCAQDGELKEFWGTDYCISA